MSAIDQQECGKCLFWARRTDNTREVGGGYCVRYPPFFPSGLSVHRPIRPSHLADIEASPSFLNDAWPTVSQESWCGEFKRGRNKWNPEKIENEE